MSFQLVPGNVHAVYDMSLKLVADYLFLPWQSLLSIDLFDPLIGVLPFQRRRDPRQDHRVNSIILK